jgi:glycosyltransferase involved in cell wall biosynthesis
MLTTPSRRLKILLSSYAAEPGKGSEEGTGWAAITQLSRDHDVWAVICKDFKPSIDKFLETNSMPNVRWVYFELPRWMLFGKKPGHGYRRVHYYFWQIAAYGIAERLHREVGFDVTHHITYGSYWRPSFLARLPAPFLWGPIGGAAVVPLNFYRTLERRDIVFDIIKRTVERSAAALDPFVRITARRATIALAPNDGAEKRIRLLGARNIRRMSQISLPGRELDKLGALLPRRSPSPFRLISLGRLIGWKGIHLGLQAFARFHAQYPDSEYWHVGDGPQASSLRKLAESLGVGSVFQIKENYTRQQALDCLAESDALVFPCLHDEPGFVVLEAMASARPIVFLLGMPNTPGGDKVGIRARADSVEHALEDMAAAMLRLATDEPLRIRMGEAGRQHVRQYFNADRRGEEYVELYEEMLGLRRRAEDTVSAGSSQAAPIKG